ncbi:MAG: response regulator [Clostridia bacterium]|nr:response regulator [Clostridia bacterium]
MKHLNILLVDDEHESRASLVEFLRDIGYEVTECANGADALQAFANREFHLVLSDIRMPRMSGNELLREIRSRSEDVDVVLFTGYGDMDSAIEALRLGAYDYLLKPVNIKELVSVAEQVAEHQALKRENKILNTKFEEAVQEAARDTGKNCHGFAKPIARWRVSGISASFPLRCKRPSNKPSSCTLTVRYPC